MPSRAPRETILSVSRASTGKICPVSHSISGKSSAKPRKKVMGTCVWALISPGISSTFPKFLRTAGLHLASSSAALPVSRIFPSRTATAASPAAPDCSAPPSMREAVTSKSHACCSMAQNVPHRERSGNFISPGLRISRPFDISCLTSKEKTAKNGPQLNSPFIPI